MATCPYCDGEVGEAAQKCRHCGEWLTEQPAEAPEAALAEEDSLDEDRKWALTDAINRATMAGRSSSRARTTPR